MKARAMLLMLPIMLMCFTGFGNTTADLSKNSTAILFNQSDDVKYEVVKVVSDQHFVAIQQNIMTVNVQKSLSIFLDNEVYLEKDYENHVKNSAIPPDRPNQTRKARDGLVKV